jgi:lipoprotein NlpD
MEGIIKPLKNAHLLRDAAPIVVQRTFMYVSQLRTCVPCIWTFLNGFIKGIHISKALAYICSALIITVFLVSCSTTSYGQKEPAKGIYHRIKKGETFWSIARAYHIKLQDLAEINNIDNPGLIEEGSVLFIPDANQVIDDVMSYAKTMDSPSKPVPDQNGTGSILPAKQGDGAKDLKAVAEMPPVTEKEELPAPAIKEKAKAEKTSPSQDLHPKDTVPAKKTLSNKKERKSKAKSAVEEKEEIQFERRRFVWPVRGSVKTRFGIQPNKTYHNWIKIVSVSGAQVKAAASGIVIFSSLLKDYGETIIIRHEDNFATVYTHLKKRYVKIDQNVKKGEAIALVGGKDEAGEAYMNFEVRLHGKARNPLFFLP